MNHIFSSTRWTDVGVLGARNLREHFTTVVGRTQVGGSSVMVWGMFSWYWLHLLLPLEGTLNQYGYLSIIADKVHADHVAGVWWDLSAWQCDMPHHPIHPCVVWGAQLRLPAAFPASKVWPITIKSVGDNIQDTFFFNYNLKTAKKMWSKQFLQVKLVEHVTAEGDVMSFF